MGFDKIGTDHLRTRDGETSPNYGPVHEVTMYQARCTNCGQIEDDYGDFGALDDSGAAAAAVVDYHGWFADYECTGDVTTAGTEIRQLSALLCPDCQHCEVCGTGRAYEIDDHLLCPEHEGHEFVDD